MAGQPDLFDASWSREECPDCHGSEWGEQQEDDGHLTVLCLGCGFGIAGPNPAVVRRALAVLHRWARGA